MQIEGTLGPYQNAGAPVSGTNEVQTITPSAAPASGTFKLKFDGYETAALDFDASASEVAAALNALDNIGASGVGVALDGGTGVYTVTFSGANLAIRNQNPITVVENTLLTSGAAAVTLTVATTTPGVNATCLGALKGALLIDTTNGILYQNLGTPAAPTWSKILAGITLSAAQVNALTASVAALANSVLGTAAGFKIARGVATITADSQDIVTGLTTVVAANVSLAGDPTATHSQSSATIGDQAGAPAAGSIRIKSWKPTSTSNPVLVAATTPWSTVNWFAIGV